MGSFENLVNLNASLFCLKTLLDDIGWEFQLAEPNEIAGDEVEYLIISFLVIELEDVLHKIVAVWILDEKV